MNLKGTTFIILALVLILALAACGQKTEESVGDDNPKTDAPAVTTPAPAATEPAVTSEPPAETLMDEKGDDEMTEDRVFTLEELSKFNGRDGQPAYIAVDGIVYDVSDVGAWRNGKHQGFEAGKDVTDQIAEISPHGTRVLDNLPKVGTLAD